MWVGSLLDNGVWPVSSLSPNGYRVRIASIVVRHPGSHSVMKQGRGEVPLRVPNSYSRQMVDMPLGLWQHLVGR